MLFAQSAVTNLLLKYPVKSMKKRLVAVIVPIVILVGMVGFVSYRNRPTTPEVFVTRAAGQPAVTWHTMQPAWRTPTGDANTGQQIAQLDIVDNIALYINGTTLYALDIQTGEPKWHRDLMQDGAHGNSNQNLEVHIKSDEDSRVFVYEQFAEFNSGGVSPTAQSMAACLELQTGKPLWKSTIAGPISSEPAIANNNLLFVMASGEVTALNKANGQPAWRKLISRTLMSIPQNVVPPRNEVKFAGGICIARVGGKHYLRLDPDTGAKIWSASVSAEENMDESLSNSGINYMVVSQSGVFILNDYYTALNPTNGKPLWEAQAPDGLSLSGQIQTPILTENDVIFINGSKLEAYNRITGKPHWAREFKNPQGDFGINISQLTWDRLDPTHRCLYMVGQTNTPVVHRKILPSRAVSDIGIQIAIDPATGKELWRAMLPDLFPSAAIVAGNKVFGCDGSTTAVAEAHSPAVSFSMLRGERQSMARRMLQISTVWQPGAESFISRLISRIFSGTSNHASKATTSETRAALTILQLGKDSTPALTEMLESAVSIADKLNLSTDQLLESSLLSTSMGYICDVNDPDIEPVILRMFAAKHKPGTLAALASILVQLNTGRAFNALFTYAKTCTDADFATGEAALYYICRFAPQTGGASPVTQQQVTSYLMSTLNDPNAAAWIKRFACFELAHNRGTAELEAARNVVRAVPSTRLMPDFATLKSSFGAGSGINTLRTAPIAQVKCPDGKLRGLFLASYFSNRDLWLADSLDGKQWKHPVLVEPNNRYSEASCELTVASKAPLRLHFSGLKVRNATSDDIDVAALTIDSDGDGIPDHTEQQLGLSPSTKQTQGTFVPDAFNLVPQYHVRKLTEQEQIFSALVSALAQYLQLTHRFKPTVPTQLSDFLTSRGCLVPCMGPANRPVPVESTDVPVIFPQGDYVSSSVVFLTSGQNEAGFAKSNSINFRVSMGYSWFAPGNYSVPYSLSKDGNSARVCAALTGSDRPVFEIEVRRVAGKWIPAECRLMTENRQSYARCPAPIATP